MAERIESLYDPKVFEDMMKFNTGVESNIASVNNLFQAAKKAEDEFRKSSKSNEDATVSRKNLTEAEKESIRINNSLEKTTIKISQAQSEQNKKLLLLQTQQQKQLVLLKAEARVKAAAKGSNEKLTATIGLYEKRLQRVNQTTAKGKLQADKLRGAIDRMNAKLTKQSSQFVKTKRGIGGYSEGITDALGKSGLFARELSILSRIQATLTSLTNKKTVAQNASTTATSLGTKALKIFKIALLSTGIGALVVALGSMVAFFKSSEEGAAALQRVMSPFKILFGNLKDIIIKLGGAMVGAFTDPKEAVIGLWETIKTNIVNRVTGLMDVFKFFGKTIKAAFDLDFDAVKENAAKAGESLVQSITGVDDAIGKAKTALKGFAEENKKENEQNKKLANDKLALIKQEREFSIKNAELEVAIQNNRLKLKDEENLTNSERLVFAEKAQEQINEQSKLEDELARKRLEYRRLENSFSTSSQEDLDAEAQLKVELINVEANNAKKLLRIESEKQTILKKMNADRLADVKSVSEKMIPIKQEEANLEVELEVDKLNRIVEANIEITNQSLESDKEVGNEKQEVAASGAAILDSIVNRSSQNQLKALEDKRKKGTISEEQFEKEREKIEKKGAIRNKLITVGKIILEGLLGAAKLNFVKVAAAAGALVTALATPAYEKGTLSSKEGTALVGEKGYEIGIEPSGKTFVTANKPELRHLKGGTQIIPHEESKAILAAGMRGSGGNMAVINSINRGNNKIVNAIENNPAYTMRKGSKDSLTLRHGNVIKKYNDIQFS